MTSESIPIGRLEVFLHDAYVDPQRGVTQNGSDVLIEGFRETGSLWFRRRHPLRALIHNAALISAHDPVKIGPAPIAEVRLAESAGNLTVIWFTSAEVVIETSSEAVDVSLAHIG